MVGFFYNPNAIIILKKSKKDSPHARVITIAKSQVWSSNLVGNNNFQILTVKLPVQNLVIRHGLEELERGFLAHPWNTLTIITATQQGQSYQMVSTQTKPGGYLSHLIGIYTTTSSAAGVEMPEYLGFKKRDREREKTSVQSLECFNMLEIMILVLLSANFLLKIRA